MTVEELTAAIDRTHPNLIDPFEAAAVVESLGYSDRRVAESFGLPSTLALGRHVHRAQLGRRACAGALGRPIQYGRARTRPGRNLEPRLCVPWLLVFLVESRDPGFLHLAPALAAPLTLALMASLVVSGGFVQAIARRAQFCIAIDQIALARLTCRHLMLVGLSVSGVIAAAALLRRMVFFVVQHFQAHPRGVVLRRGVGVVDALRCSRRGSSELAHSARLCGQGITFSAFRMLNVERSRRRRAR